MKIIQTSREALPMAAMQASQPGQLTIDVLGGLRLSQGEATLPLPNRKARAILAYLALEAAPAIARERLAGLFWSESSERHARSSLRQTLFEVREVLKGFGIVALRTGRPERRSSMPPAKCWSEWHPSV